ncbi:MAG: hypothetical protein LBJ31_01355 [Treponema sp.]|jgi:hypothetical protein|nr:hypothetical protein [Treponema sp.]
MIQFESFCRQIGLKQVNEVFYGRYLQYWLTLAKNNAEGTDISLSMVIDKSISFEKMKEALLETENPGTIEINENLIEIQIIGDFYDTKSLLDRINKILSICNEFGVKSICQICKTNIPDGYYNYNGEIVPVCTGCIDKINLLNEETKSPNLKSYITGSIGALTGALIGSAVWIIVGLVGFYASIGGVAISYASFTGYTKLGGKSNKASILIIGVSILAAVIFAEMVGLGIEIAKYAKGENYQLSLIQVVQILFAIIKSGENMGEIVRNMLVGLLFAGLGSWGLLTKIFKKAESAKITIEKI